MSEPNPMPTGHSLPLLVLVAIVLALAILLECLLPSQADAATAPPTHPELTSRQTALVKLLGPGVVGDPIALEPIKHVKNWYPLQDSDVIYVHCGGDDKGDQQEVSLNWVNRNPQNPVGCTEGAWTLNSTKKDIKYLTEVKGHLRLPTETDLDQGVITVFDPPEPLLLAGIDEGGSRKLTTNVSVYDMHSPGTLKYTGTLDVTYVDLGGYMLHVPSGTYKARLISVSSDGKVGPADVNTEYLAFYAKGVGRVAYINRKHVSAFLIYNKTTQHGMVLSSINSGVDLGPRSPGAGSEPAKTGSP